jgi:hypothetical protein
MVAGVRAVLADGCKSLAPEPLSGMQPRQMQLPFIGGHTPAPRVIALPDFLGEQGPWGTAPVG